MPTLRSIGHKLATGTRTVSYMNSTAALITAWPLQTDQDNGWVSWEAPSYELGTTPPRYARYRVDANQQEVGDGPRLFEWVFDYWTTDMLAYFKTTYTHGSDVTVLTYDDTDTVIYLTAVVLHPIPNEHMEWQEGGWANVRIRFVQGRVIT